MFTGLVEEVAKVRRIEEKNNSAHIELEADIVLEDVRLGDSIAVNGVCLTVVRFSKSTFVADAVPETMRRTNLGRLKPGDLVNVERAMKLGGRFGGHIVSGHVDGTGKLRSLESEGLAVNLTFEAPMSLLRYIAQKGSICIDGISLTVMSVARDSFSVSVIPHTGASTTLQRATVGHIVNLEVDVFAKYIERMLGLDTPNHALQASDVSGRPGINLDFLTQNGFV